MNMISLSNEFSCTISAPTSSRFCQEDIIKCFYSVPTSPTFKFNTTSPYASSQHHEEDDEFEFETSRRFNNRSDFDDVDSRREEEDDDDDEKQKQKKWSQIQSGDSMPSMAFADELFSDGKVLPLKVPPLKLPPRLQNNGSDNKIKAASLSSSLSPRSSFGSARRLRFPRRSFWNDDFDPFMEALEVVKGGEEKRGKSKERHGIRRTRSLSPFRAKSPNEPNGPHCGPDKFICEISTKEPLRERPRSPCKPSYPHCGPAHLTCEFPKQPLKPKSTSPNMLLYEPKGLVFARRVKLVGVDKNGPIEPNKTKEERKRKKIRRFLFGKASVEEHKLKKDQKEELGKLLGLELDKDETIREVKKMTLSYYKPRFLLCLGYGGRYVK